jgi:transposase
VAAPRSSGPSWTRSTSSRLGPGRARERPVRVRADKAYSSGANRAYLRRRGIAATIPEPADRLKRHRAVATRYDKLAVRYEATLHIAVINDWLLTSL